MRRLLFAGFFAAAARCLAQDSLPARHSAPGALRLEPITLKFTDGSKPVVAELGRLKVLENRSRPDGATIELAFVRLKTTASRPGPPVVWLAGGPGGSGTHDAEGRLFPLLRNITEFSDVIALDQRGMGRSRPRLDCPGRFDLPLDRPMERNFVLAAFRDRAGGCRAYWIRQGVDLASYNAGPWTRTRPLRTRRKFSPAFRTAST